MTLFFPCRPLSLANLSPRRPFLPSSLHSSHLLSLPSPLSLSFFLILTTLISLPFPPPSSSSFLPPSLHCSYFAVPLLRYLPLTSLPFQLSLSFPAFPFFYLFSLSCPFLPLFPLNLAYTPHAPAFLFPLYLHTLPLLLFLPFSLYSCHSFLTTVPVLSFFLSLSSSPHSPSFAVSPHPGLSSLTLLHSLFPSFWSSTPQCSYSPFTFILATLPILPFFS